MATGAGDIPHDSGDPEAIFAEWAMRAESGEALDFRDLVRKYAAHAEQLERLHEDWKLFAPILGKVVPGLIANESGVVSPSLSGGPDSDDDVPSAELLARLGIHTPNEGRYRFRAVLGRGGGGVVLKVWDTKLNRPLAMKVVLGRGEDRPTGQTPRVDGRTLARFVDEARIASQLNHPGIVPVHELGADDTGRAFFTMKLVRGEDLSRVFEHVREGRDGWNQTRALGVLLRVCEAMAYAHDKGVIHRDLKPANVMVGSYGEVHVMDWGLARATGAGAVPEPAAPKAPASIVDSIRKADRDHTPASPLLTEAGSVMGTPSYMSPEQAKGELESLGPATDVYAVGAMLYELICGEAPHVPRGARLDPRTILAAVVQGPPKRIEDLTPRASAELVAICEKAMARDVTERYATMQTLGDDLKAFLDRRVVSAFETGTWAETKKWVRRNKALALLFATTTLLLVAGLAVATFLKTRSDAARGEAVRDRDIARWRGLTSIARDAFPEDVEMRAMIIREAPVTVSDSYSERRSIEMVTGEYHRLCSLIGHKLAVSSATISFDGNHVATVSNDGTVRIWNADGTGEPAVLDASGIALASAEWSPNDNRIVAVGKDRVARIWRADASGKQIALPVSDEVDAVAWSPDGRRMLSISYPNGNVSIVDADRINSRFLIVDGTYGSLSSAKWSPDGSRIVTISTDGRAQVWDANAPGEPIVLPISDEVDAVEWSPDGRRLLSIANSSGRVSIWDAGGIDEPLVIVDGDCGTLWSAEWSPDGERIATGGSDWAVRVWSADRVEEPLVLPGHQQQVTKVVWSHDGKRIASASDDNTSRVWRTDGTGASVILRGHANNVLCVAWDREDRRIVTASKDGTARVWRVDASNLPSVLSGHADAVKVALWSPDGRQIVTCSADSTARIWNADGTGEYLALQGHSRSVTGAAWSPDGHQLVTWSDDKTARVWGMDGSIIRVLAEHEGVVTSGMWSPDGRHIVTTSADCKARVWNLAGTGDPVVLQWHSDRVNAAAWSPDGLRIATASGDHSVAIGNADGSSAPLVREGHEGSVDSVVWSADGKRVLSASEDHTARVWTVGNSTEVIVLLGHERQQPAINRTAGGGWSFSGFQSTTTSFSSMKNAFVAWAPGQETSVSKLEADKPASFMATSISSSALNELDEGGVLSFSFGGAERTFDKNSATWSPDDSRVLITTYDATSALVWNADGSGVSLPLPRHDGRVNSAGWSRDGGRVVTASDDGTVHVVSVTEGHSLYITLRGHGGAVNGAAWSPDGRRIVTASADKTARVWILDWPTLSPYLWDAVDDLLSPDERIRYLGESDAEAHTNYSRQKAERDARVLARKPPATR